MTVQYDGNNYYLIWLGDTQYKLSKEEIAEIQAFNFLTMKKTDTVEELENKIADLTDDFNDQVEIIEDLQNEVDYLKDENDFLKQELKA